MIKRYRKKPVVIEAIHWDGTNLNEIHEWVNGAIRTKTFIASDGEVFLEIETLEGDMRSKIGSYIIKGVRGEFYPCDKEIFEETYDEVTDEQ